jgi:hypothetical protein
MNGKMLNTPLIDNIGINSEQNESFVEIRVEKKQIKDPFIEQMM